MGHIKKAITDHRIFMVVMMASFFIGCSNSTGSDNNAPVIDRIDTGPNPLFLTNQGGWCCSTQFTAFVSDPDNDPVTLRWRSTAGEFLDPTANPAKWGPASGVLPPGNYTITLEVSDGEDTTTSSFTITIQ